MGSGDSDEPDWHVQRGAGCGDTPMQQVDKGGSIVAIASIAGIRVAARAAAYAASKAGIIHLTKVLAYEWAPHGIRVNAIAPGYSETEMTQDLLATERAKAIIGRIRWGASAK
jgi:NAD(P)-dependent dehydrogenase (short-subunit alcohol dehydrogenase family)